MGFASIENKIFIFRKYFRC